MVQELLQLVVKHQDQRRTHTPPNIRQVTLEKTSESLSAQHLTRTINSALVHTSTLSLTALHHQSPSNRVQRISQSLRR